MRIKTLCLFVVVLIACKTQKPSGTGTTPTKTNKPVSGKTSKAEPKKMSEDSLDIKIGQMILVGINERTALSSSDPLIKELSEKKIGGIALFEKNISKKKSHESLKQLIADLQKQSPIPMFISIDEEGGYVHRLKEKYGFPKMPSALYLGTLDNEDSTLFYTKRLASTMSDLGINLNFAPCLDLGTNKNNPIIYKVERCYSEDPKVVSKHAILSIQAQHEYGIKTILKHFPGHGSSSTDSHLGITEVTNQWTFTELMPYKDLFKTGQVDAVMTAHIVNCHLDTSCLPATLSKVVITDVLRGLMDFQGVIISDDMQMNAISKNYGMENAIKLSINAGVDIMLFGNNVNADNRITASEIHAIIKKLVKNGDISEARINEAYQRIMALKKKRVK